MSELNHKPDPRKTQDPRTDPLTQDERDLVEGTRIHAYVDNDVHDFSTYRALIAIIDRLAAAPAPDVPDEDIALPQPPSKRVPGGSMRQVVRPDFPGVDDDAPEAPAPEAAKPARPLTPIEIATIQRRIDDEGLQVLDEYGLTVDGLLNIQRTSKLTTAHPVRLTKLQRELLQKVCYKADKGDWYLDKSSREYRCLTRLRNRGLVEGTGEGEGLWRCYWDITKAGRAALKGVAS